MAACCLWPETFSVPLSGHSSVLRLNHQPTTSSVDLWASVPKTYDALDFSPYANAAPVFVLFTEASWKGERDEPVSRTPRIPHVTSGTDSGGRALSRSMRAQPGDDLVPSITATAGALPARSGIEAARRSIPAPIQIVPPVATWSAFPSDRYWVGNRESGIGNREAAQGGRLVLIRRFPVPIPEVPIPPRRSRQRFGPDSRRMYGLRSASYSVT